MGRGQRALVFTGRNIAKPVHTVPPYGRPVPRREEFPGDPMAHAKATQAWNAEFAQWGIPRFHAQFGEARYQVENFGTPTAAVYRIVDTHSRSVQYPRGAPVSGDAAQTFGGVAHPDLGEALREASALNQSSATSVLAGLLANLDLEWKIATDEAANPGRTGFRPADVKGAEVAIAQAQAWYAAYPEGVYVAPFTAPPRPQ